MFKLVKGDKMHALISFWEHLDKLTPRANILYMQHVSKHFDAYSYNYIND